MALKIPVWLAANSTKGNLMNTGVQPATDHLRLQLWAYGLEGLQGLDSLGG